MLVCVVNGDARRMGKGVAALLVILTSVTLLRECHSQGEVRELLNVKDAPFRNLLLLLFTHRIFYSGD